MTTINEITDDLFAASTLVNLPYIIELHVTGAEEIRPEMVDFFKSYISEIEKLGKAPAHSPRAPHYFVLVERAYKRANELVGKVQESDELEKDIYVPHSEEQSEQFLRVENERLQLGECLETLGAMLNGWRDAVPGTEDEIFEWTEPGSWAERKTIAQYLPCGGHVLVQRGNRS